MKPKDFLDWYPYQHHGSKRMYQNYKILRKVNPTAFEKLKTKKKFKYNITMGKILQFNKDEK